jgi:hypothetical protein
MVVVPKETTSFMIFGTISIDRTINGYLTPVSRFMSIRNTTPLQFVYLRFLLVFLFRRIIVCIRCSCASLVVPVSFCWKSFGTLLPTTSLHVCTVACARSGPRPQFLTFKRCRFLRIKWKRDGSSESIGQMDLKQTSFGGRFRSARGCKMVLHFPVLWVFLAQYQNGLEDFAPARVAYEYVT